MLSNQQVATIFSNIADMLEIMGESKFRFLSYRRASEIISELPRDLAAYVEDGTLEDIPGVGKAIADKIREMLNTGQLAYYEKLKAQVPETLVEVMRVNGVGPKKAKLFWDQLGVTTLAALNEAAAAGKLRDLPGMGVKSEAKIVESIAALARQTGRFPIGKARPSAEAVLNELMTVEGALEGALAGSLRRGKTTIGDVDILIASETPEPLMERFVSVPRVARILGKGETKSSIETDYGLQMDLRVLKPSQWGTALQYFTGSKEHNIRIRELALAKGYSLNESAFSPVDAQGNIIPDAPKITFAREEEVYEFLGLPWIPPELRENNGEIEAALQGKLPTLITRADLFADLHMHTTWSDGALSIREMAQHAIQRGHTYICITDHSRSLGVANGLSIERLMEQRQEVRQLNDEFAGRITILHGTEMDIKADATLDFPDDVLAELDFVIASLHVSLSQPRSQITDRLLAAIHNPHVDLIGHPSARYVPDREPVDADWDAVFDAAAKTGVALEINSNPRRLDLDAPYVRRAIELGIPICINTDAHSPAMLDDLSYGVTVARRGWVEARHVLNAKPLDEFLAWARARGT
ncbi:MAG: DNA polymerase/3'-5' exonuclease PolX [Anaerolinea sp.]